ncbi:MAG: ester cyclase [Pseudomonadales bacterium]|nr:ester cyclase [Pseudomonadales bacterium]
MNLEWESNWLKQFDNNLENLMANYPESFEYEDLIFGIRIVNDKNKLRALFATMDNTDPNSSRHYFEALRYHGDNNVGCIEWGWKMEHKTDFLGLPAVGKTTYVTGMTVHNFVEGKITLERSMWDTGCLMRQLGLKAPDPQFVI